MFRVPSAFSLFCILSVVGIWPRFIEPHLLTVTRLQLPLVKENFKVVQISDLHFSDYSSPGFLSKIIQKVKGENPTLIMLTGDFICNGQLSDPHQLKEFLKALKARLGVFAVLGNHDYNALLGVNEEGDYDTILKTPSPFLSGMSRLFKKPALSGLATSQAKATMPHPDLLQVLKDSQVTLLDNQTVQVGPLNLTGLGEWMGGHTCPEKAFNSYDHHLPGLVLVHNPDAVKHLVDFPGQLILAGHLHGGQVNLPWLWRRFTATENPDFKAGLYPFKDKVLYISRGVGGVFPFRFNAVPEIVAFSLGGAK